MSTWTHPRTGQVFRDDYRLGEQPAPAWRCQACDSEIMAYNAPLGDNVGTEPRIRLLHEESCRG